MITNSQLDKRELLLRLAVAGLLDNGVDDPQLRLFQAIFDEDVEAAKAAIQDGADLKVTDAVLIRRHLKELLRPPVSQSLVLGLIATLMSPRPESEKDAEQQETGLARAA